METTAFFNVVREPAFTMFNGSTIEVDKDVLINEDNGNVLGIVSKKYNLVQNTEVKNYFEEAFKGYNVEVKDDHLSNNNSKWIREIVFNDDKFSKEIAPDDVVNLKLKFWNGYDGRTSIGYGLEGYRQICTNGMMGWRNLFSTNLTHWGVDIIGIIKKSFENNFNNYINVFDKMTEWTTKPFTQKDFISFIDSKTKNDTPDKKRYLSEKQAETTKSLYPVIMNQYNENETKWGAYNVLTAIATHHTKTKSTNSHLFTHGYKRTERLTEDFVNL